MWAGPTLLTATAGYAHDDIHTARNFAGLGTAREGHGGDEATAALQWSAPMVMPTVWGDATVTPKLGVQFLHLSEGGFQDNGAGGLDLSNAGHDTDSFQPYIGLTVAHTFSTPDGMLFTPEIRVGYSREVLNNSGLLTVAATDGTPFIVRGVRPSRDMLTAGVGVTVPTQYNFSFYANYDAQVRTGNTFDETLSAGLRIRF